MNEEIEVKNSGAKKLYCNGMLSVWIPNDVFVYVRSKTCGLLSQKNEYSLTGMVWLMTMFSHRLEFKEADLAKALGISTGQVSKLLKYGEDVLFDINKEKYVCKEGGYEYRLKEDFNKFGGPRIPYSYNLNDTAFGKALDLFSEYRDAECIQSCGDSHWAWDAAGGYYLSPYWRLSFRFSHEAMLSKKLKFIECDEGGTVFARFSNPPRYVSGRIYHAFHNMPKSMRYHLECDGSPITELFDLHASFFTLLSSMIRDQLPEKEFNELFDECFSGNFYKNIAAYIGSDKDTAKDIMQGWRNVCSVAFLHSSPKYAKASEYMEKKYPVFSKIVYEWNFIETKDGVKKTIQQDCGAYETKVFSAFAEYLVKEYGITPYTLHDAVYCTESDKEKLPENIDEIMRDWFLKRLKI